MTAAASPRRQHPTPVQCWILAGAATGVCDFAWANTIRLIYHRPLAALWRGVASVPFGAKMVDGGTPAVLIGIATHFGVAFAWSGVLLLMVLGLPTLRRILNSRFGVVKVAAVYGPMIWIVMSLIAIPVVTGKPAATLTYRWWIELAGHFVFVGLPMVWSINRGRGVVSA